MAPTGVVVVPAAVKGTLTVEGNSIMVFFLFLFFYFVLLFVNSSVCYIDLELLLVIFRTDFCLGYVFS